MDRLYGPPWNPTLEYGPWEYTVDRASLGLVHTLKGAEAWFGALIRGENAPAAFEAARQAAIDQMHRFEEDRAVEAYIANIIAGFATRGLSSGKYFFDGFMSTEGDVVERALAGVLNLAANQAHGLMIDDILRELDGLPQSVITTVVREAIGILGLGGPGINSPFSMDFPDPEPEPMFVVPDNYAEPVVPYVDAPVPYDLPPLLPPPEPTFVLGPYYGWGPDPVIPPELLRAQPQWDLRRQGVVTNPFELAAAALPPMPSYLEPGLGAPVPTPLRIAARPDADTLLRTQRGVPMAALGPTYFGLPDHAAFPSVDPAGVYPGPQPVTAAPSLFRRLGAGVTGALP
ncbi:MAG: hypothetical protein KIS68_16065 [Bauldia sp.]|nr:hypothetical protein [Bauldia sp.]